jgi:HrpA-like RNA helicase
MHAEINNSSLPVAAFRAQIEEAVHQNRVVIITAETGAGKSTQVPQMLASAGYRVVVTQPRRLAARALAQRVSQEMDSRLGDRVGFRTAEDRADSAATEVLFVTDGLQLVRELAGHGGTGRKTVLILDEVHEWNMNVEVLIAWVKSRINAGDDLRVILMSATLDAERLASYYGNAPVISVPGRLFPVEKKSAAARDLITEVVSLAKQGRNVLVFQPGKREIADTVDQIVRALGETAIVLPLHGELEAEEQQRCFAPPPTGRVKVVVSTNVAQTSVTISDIDAVVDSGIERRIELVDGIEGLYLGPISQADCHQRAGRAGRTKAGVYVLCSETSMTDRQPFPIAEIMRSRLDQMVLRLAVQGFDATKLEFCHQPDKDALVDARRSLVALGAMSGEGTVTKIGRRMARFSVSCEYARMLIEAERHGVVEQVATIAACLEAGDIRGREGAWRSLTQESRSDLLAILDVYLAGQQMKGRSGQSKAESLREAGIFVKDFFRASELRRKLLDATRSEVCSDTKKFATKEEERQAILKACVAGLVDHLYRRQYGRYVNGSSSIERELARESAVRGGPEWLVGLPKDIQIKDRRNRLMTLRLVSMATAVDPMLLAEVAPQLVELRTSLRPYFDPAKDSVVSTTETYFNGQKVREAVFADPEHPEAADIFCTWLAAQMAEGAESLGLQMFITHNRDVQRNASELNARAGEKIFPVMRYEDIEQWLKTRLGSARRVSEVKSLDALMLAHLDPKLIERVMHENPDEITVLGRAFSVEYWDSCSPRITLDHETIAAHSWRELPDAGVKLPGGRLVEIDVSFGYYDRVSSQDIPALKLSCMSHVNKRLWDNWPIADRPVIASPDPADLAASVPEILECPYGISVIDGTRLIAFGTAALNDYRYYSLSPWFEGKWFQVREEADEARAKAVAKLESLRKEAGEQKQLNTARKTAEEAQELLSNVQSNEGWYDLDCAIRSRVDQRYYTYLPSELEELQVWTQVTNALLAEIEAARKAAAKVSFKKTGHILSAYSDEAPGPVSAEQVSTSLGDLRAKFGKKR